MKPIRTEAEYREVMDRIARLEAQPDADDNKELELLTIAAMAYESEQAAEQSPATAG